MAVTKCVCFRRPFGDLLREARTAGWTTAEEITAATGCGSGCGGCRPYLAAMLATGRTVFRVRVDDRPPVPCDPDPWDT